MEHWSKDYVEHLRTAYFALVVVCLGALVIAFAPGAGGTSRAHQQLDQIWGLAESWNPQFLQADATKAEAKLPPPFSPSPVKLTVDGRSVVVRLQVVGPTAFVTLNNDPNKIGGHTDCSIEPPERRPPNVLDPRRVADRIPAPQTVQQFAAIWNELQDGATKQDVVWATGEALARAVPSRHQDPFLPVQLEQARDAKEVDIQDLHLGLQCLVPSSVDGIKRLNREVPTTYQLHGTLHAGRLYNLYFPIEELDTKGVDGQGLLFQGRTELWHRGYFKNSFRELSALLEGTNNLTWEGAGQKVADDEVNVPAENFEALGMKFPAQVSLDWAAVVVFCVQWYFWAQLYEFRRRLRAKDDGWNVAWIGMYRSYPARTLFIVSVLLLPVVAATAVGWRRLNVARSIWLSRTELVIGVGVALALAVATQLVLPTANGAEEQ